jgi:uncharacterized protein (TIGR02246 family)
VTSAHPHDAQIRALYAAFIDGWNQRSGAAVSSGFADDGELIGFDGSQTAGRLSIAAEFRKIFGSHQTPLYVALIRSVRPMADGVAVLHAHAGAIPAGGNDLDPDLLTVHTMVAVHDAGRWRIGLLQATPAAWHQRPEAREALIGELRGLLTPS